MVLSSAEQSRLPHHIKSQQITSQHSAAALSHLQLSIRDVTASWNGRVNGGDSGLLGVQVRGTPKGRTVRPCVTDG